MPDDPDVRTCVCVRACVHARIFSRNGNTESASSSRVRTPATPTSNAPCARARFVHNFYNSIRWPTPSCRDTHTHTHIVRQSRDKLFKCLQFQSFVALCQKPRVPLFLAALNVSIYAVRLQYVTRLAYIQYTACVCWTGLFTRSSCASFRCRSRCRCRRRRRRRRRRRCCRRRRCRADGWAVATSPRHSPTVTRSIPRLLPCALAVPCTLRRHKHTHTRTVFPFPPGSVLFQISVPIKPRASSNVCCACVVLVSPSSGCWLTYTYTRTRTPSNIRVVFCRISHIPTD